MAQIAIMGYGTVGAGVYKTLTMNRDVIAKRAGEEIQVKRVLDLRDFPGDEAESKVTHDFADVLSDPEISVVVETMGGLKPAYTFTKQLLEAGKSVCTSNKELVEALGTDRLPGSTPSTTSLRRAAGAASPLSACWIHRLPRRRSRKSPAY